MPSNTTKNMASEHGNDIEKEKGKENVKEDYLSQLFYQIDWDSRVKPTTDRRPGLGSEQLKTTFMHKYLWYQLEPEQIDLDNPFHVEEGNSLRPKLAEKKKKSKTGGADLELVTEGMKEIKENDNTDVEEEEDDFMDEYGNIKTKEMQEMEKAEKAKKKREKQSQINAGKVKQKQVVKTEEENKDGNKKEGKKLRKRFEARKFSHQQKAQDAPSQHWNDLDSELVRREQNSQGKKLFLGKSLNFKFPRASSLNARQQSYYLSLLNKQRHNNLHGDEYQTFLEMQAVVAEERTEFSQFSREMCQDNQAKYEFILPSLDKYVTEHRKARIERVMKHPRYWNKLRDVRMAAARREQGDLDHLDHYYLSHLELILERGILPLANVPDLAKSKRLNLPVKYERIVHKFPADPTIKPGSQGISRSEERHFRATMNEPNIDMKAERVPDNTYIHKLSTMEDPNAIKLAAIYTPDVIISAAALKCILDNLFPSFSRSWDIPVFVQEFSCNDGKSENKKVIFIGKPFLSRRVTACDRNKLAYKYSVRTWMNKDWGTGGKPKEKSRDINPNVMKEKFDTVKNDEDDFLFGANLDDFETFGDDVAGDLDRSSEPKKSGKKEKTASKKRKRNHSNEEADVKSVSQVDGSISAMSFADMNLEGFNLTELLADPGKIVLEPGNLDQLFHSVQDDSASKDFTFSQLDGAVSSDDEELMIDLGDKGQETKKSSHKDDPKKDTVVEKTPPKSIKTNSPVKPSNNESKTVERRSLRLKAQKIEETQDEKEGMDDDGLEYDEMGELQKEMEKIKNESQDYIKDKDKKDQVKQESSVTVNSATKDTTKVDPKLDQVKSEEKTKPPNTNNLEKKGIPASDILDSLLSGQTALHGKQQVNKQKKEKADYKGEDLKVGHACLGPLDSYLPPLPGTNYSYRLWSLSNTKKQNSIFRLIIRSKIPAYSPWRGVMVPSVKLEYQTNLGAEQCTVSECCREWTDNLLRPAASTIRYRIDPETGLVLMVEQVDLKKLREEGAQEHRQQGDEGPAPDRFDPSVQLANLHNLITDLKGLSAGNYLVSHDSNSGAFCRLYQAATEKGDFDLHDSYSSIRPEDVTPHNKVPWRQIDYNVVTPWHLHNRRVPGTFEPARKSFDQ